MAGFFGLFNYEKEGPGIEKDAPKKKAFIVFFETFFRNFWKFIIINIVYSIISLPILTSGLASAGLTNVARNIARDKHSFGLSDFFETIRKNWKQSLISGIINTLIYVVLGFASYFYFTSEGFANSIGLGVCLCAFLIFSIMQFYIYTLMITFNFKLSQVYKNSFKFVFINLKGNLVCILGLLASYAIYIALPFIFQNQWIAIVLIEVLVAALTFPAYKFLLIQFCTFPSIKKMIIDPYYEAHPFEDIERRRALGLEINEQKPQTEDEEQTEENE